MVHILSTQAEDLTVIHGRVSNRHFVKELTSRLKAMDLHGTLYQGYLLPGNADNLLTVDALLVAKECGVIAFTFAERSDPEEDTFWENISNTQENVFFALRNHLTRQKGLRKRREELVTPEVVTILPTKEEPPEEESIVVTILDDITDFLANKQPVEEKYWRPLNAAIENVTTIKPPKKRTKVMRIDSRGAILKRIEASISNLDYWQKRATLETPDGPQRIRGLAGSGKTVVLAMKAAALHAQNPDWNIAVTFFTRALHQQFKDLITRFSFEYQRDEPDWDKLRILHSWGARTREGLYRVFAHQLDVVPGDWAYASSKYGRDKAFEGLCDELLAVAKYAKIEAVFDAVLIDEAQDMPVSFFQLVDLFTTSPHRIIFAYDELQKLSNEAMKDPDQIFVDEDGKPKYSFENREGQPRRDEILPVCYRNTPWALTLAHALGFGIHRPGIPIQHFSNPLRWERVGYKVEDGQLEFGQPVVLKRNPDSFPEYFEEELSPDDAILALKFQNDLEQAEKTAEDIRHNLDFDELEHDDILVILPVPYHSKTAYAIIRDALKRRNINSHLVGSDTDQENIFQKDSIAVTHIFRAKGNEAPMVYILNTDKYISYFSELTGRNMIFTAVTRSRAWVRIFGIGKPMDEILREIKRVRRDDYKLVFKIPTREQLKEMERVHRAIAPEEREMQRQKEDYIEWLLSAIKSGRIKKSDISKEDREMLKKFLG